MKLPASAREIISYAKEHSWASEVKEHDGILAVVCYPVLHGEFRMRDGSVSDEYRRHDRRVTAFYVEVDALDPKGNPCTKVKFVIGIERANPDVPLRIQQVKRLIAGQPLE